MPAVILASASTARRAMLRAAGLQLDVRPARIDEAAIKQAALAAGMAPADAALELARQKAAVIATEKPDAIVIGADQLLVCEKRWFNKPEDEDSTRRQLIALRGRTHRLVTAVVCQQGSAWQWQHVEQPQLTMRDFSDAFLETYLRQEGEAIWHCVGGYRLEGPGAQLFTAITGDYFTIIGLPLLPVLARLRQAGVMDF